MHRLGKTEPTSKCIPYKKQISANCHPDWLTLGRMAAVNPFYTHFRGSRDILMERGRQKSWAEYKIQSRDFRIGSSTDYCLFLPGTYAEAC